MYEEEIPEDVAMKIANNDLQNPNELLFTTINATKEVDRLHYLRAPRSTRPNISSSTSGTSKKK